MENKLVTEWLDPFMEALSDQLMDDFERWGNTWEHRPMDGQTERTQHTFDNYFDQALHGGVPVNWLKVAGNALICWVREQEAGNGKA